MTIFSQQWSIGSHFYHVTVTFYGRQIESFGKRSFYIIGASRQVGGVFAQVNFRFATVVMIVIFLVVNHPTRFYIVMLVYHRYTQFGSKVPTYFIIRTFVERTGSTNHGNFRMFCFYGIEYHLKAFHEDRCNHVLITDTDELQIERFRMSGFRALLAPHGFAGISVGIFYQVENILNVLIHFFHRNATLLSHASQLILGMVSAGTRVLTRYTGCKYRYGLRTHIFTEQEVFVVSQTACLMVSPKITKRLAGFQRTDRAFPIINIIYSIAMSHTTTGETYKTGMQVGKRLCQIGTKSVLTTFKGLLREEGNHIQRILADSLGNNGQRCSRRIACGCQDCFLLFPIFRCYIYGSLSYNSSIFINQVHKYLTSFTLKYFTKE